MSEPKIPRFKNRADFTAAEFLAEKRGELPPETAEYKEARRDALADAGLEPEETTSDDGLPTTPAEYLRRIHKGTLS
jgi:uncharacterized protein with LGFP repeats